MEEEKQKKDSNKKRNKIILISILIIVALIIILIILSNENIKTLISAETSEVTKEVITSDSYIGYYADVDGDGIVDGIIYADLAIDGSGTWGDSWGTWEYSAVNISDLKEYYISSESYTDDYFGTNFIISLNQNSVGEDRFYVMALEDVDDSYHYWYYSAYENLENNTGYTTNDFGAGITNTLEMLEAYESDLYGSKYTDGEYTELWGMDIVGSYVSSSENSIWFVPSKSEWAAFGDAFEITSENYNSTYGLKDDYWSSTQCCAKRAYYAHFSDERITSEYVIDSFYVRLSTTF